MYDLISLIRQNYGFNSISLPDSIKAIVRFNPQLNVGEILLLKKAQFCQTPIIWPRTPFLDKIVSDYLIWKTISDSTNFDESLIHSDQFQPFIYT